MTVDGNMLLKMLEPVLRPGGGGAATRPAALPVEQQSFEALLAQRMNHGQETGDGLMPGDALTAAVENPTQKNQAAGQGPLSQLARVDQIENASLRGLIARQHDVSAD